MTPPYWRVVRARTIIKYINIWLLTQISNFVYYVIRETLVLYLFLNVFSPLAELPVSHFFLSFFLALFKQQWHNDTHWDLIPATYIANSFCYSLSVYLSLYFLSLFYCFFNRAIGQMSKVFANGPGDRGSIPGWVIPKTQKMVLGAALPSTQHCKDQG